MKKQYIFLSAIVVILFFLVNLSFAALPRYEIIDLGTLGGRGWSCANAINDNGQVVGISLTDDGDHAFLWDSATGMIDLGMLAGKMGYSVAYGINDTTQVVGYSGSDDGHAFLWDSHSGMIDLGAILGGGYSEAWGINNSGYVVGEWIGHAFLWHSESGMIDLGRLGSGSSWAHAINEATKVVGASHSVSGPAHAFIWDSINGMRDLGTLGGSVSVAYGINNQGQVVGCSRYEPYNDKYHAFLWDSTNGMIDLSTPFGFGSEQSSASAINDAGQVVGTVNPWGWASAFLWYLHNGMIPLFDLLPPDSGWLELRFANDINNRGQIVGQGITDAGEYHAFLMTPVLPTIKVPMKFTPQVLNCYSKGKWIKAHFVLPAEFTIEEVDSNGLAMVHPLGIEPNYTNIFVNENGLVEIEVAFDRAYLCSVLRDSWFSEVTITVRGSFTSGQYFYGMDTIKIIVNSFEYLALLSSHWLDVNCAEPDWCEDADIDQDSLVNLNDFAFMAYH